MESGSVRIKLPEWEISLSACRTGEHSPVFPHDTGEQFTEMAQCDGLETAAGHQEEHVPACAALL